MLVPSHKWVFPNEEDSFILNTGTLLTSSAKTLAGLEGHLPPPAVFHIHTIYMLLFIITVSLICQNTA